MSLELTRRLAAEFVGTFALVLGGCVAAARAGDEPPVTVKPENPAGAPEAHSEFLTPPGELSETLATVVEEVTGIAPEASTTGGTSDARFLKSLCPVIEFGLCNATMHKRDEAVAVADLEALARIYARVARAALAG